MAHPDNLAQFDFSFWKNRKIRKFSCYDEVTGPLLNSIVAMDKYTFGDQGMSAEKWLFFDCGAMPGVIFGFGSSFDALPAAYAKNVEPDHQALGFAPISYYVAIPTTNDREWFGHNLSSIGAKLKEPYGGLGLLTKSLCLNLIGAKSQVGATQWQAQGLFVHTRISDLILESAYTPGHTYPFSLVYKSILDADMLDRVLCGKPRQRQDGHFALEATDQAKILELNQQIRAGKQFKITGVPEAKGESIIYSIVEF